MEKETSTRPLTCADIEKRLGVTKSTVRSWIKSGALRARQAGKRGKYYISERDFHRFMSIGEEKETDT